MSRPEIIIRPDLGKRPYRLRCRFITPAYPNARLLERVKYQMAERFVEDMEKRGWRYLDRHGFTMHGPYPQTPITTMPKRSQLSKWHVPSREMMPALLNGYVFRAKDDGGIAKPVPALGESEGWEYELRGVFVHDTLLAERPDEHEEVAILKGR